MAAPQAVKQETSTLFYAVLTVRALRTSPCLSVRNMRTLAMNVIAKRKVIKDAAKLDLTKEVEQWYRSARAAKWRSLADVRVLFASADKVGNLLVFNIQHNDYRLIAHVDFRYNLLLYKGVITHKEYSTGEWKKWK
jgi:mRNA interferase HigB